MDYRFYEGVGSFGLGKPLVSLRETLCFCRGNKSFLLSKRGRKAACLYKCACNDV